MHRSSAGASLRPDRFSGFGVEFGAFFGEFAGLFFHARLQGLSADEALQTGMEEKSREFTEKGAELYTKA